MAMPYRLLLVPLLAALLTGAMPARAAGPEGFCPPLFGPAGYRLKGEASPALAGGWQLPVRPDPPLQSPFTRLTIRPV